MLTLSKKLYYAIEAVLYVAHSGPMQPLSSKKIAQTLNVPPRYLEQIMQRLVRFGILESIRGPRGGYLLAHDRKNISVADVCNIVIDENDINDSTPQGSSLGEYVLSPMCDDIHNAVYAHLKEVTFEALCTRADEHNINSSASGVVDYTI